MEGARLRVADDLSMTEWIAPRLGGAFGAVTRRVPRGYAAYARICHPASNSTRPFVTWSEVAAVTGRQPHALMQWHALVGSRSPDRINAPDSDWPGFQPARGNLEPEVLEPLCEVLRQNTTTPQECFILLWEGLSWFSTRRRPHHRRSQQPIEPEQIPMPLPTDVLAAPLMVRYPHAYLLLTGPLATAAQLGWDAGFAQSPNSLWPADRAWYVSTEIDFTDTLVAGSKELIANLLDAPDLDAWQVEPTDVLALDGDRINSSL